MHPHDQHFLVIGTIEDADLPALGQPARRAPQKVMLQFFGTGLLETVRPAVLRIETGHDVAHRAVFAGRVHPLQYQQQRIAVRRIMQALQRAQRLNVFAQQFFVFLLRLEKRLHHRRPLLEIDLLSRPHPEFLYIDFVTHRRFPSYPRFSH